MNTITQIKKELEPLRNPEKAAKSPKFFQVHPGGYGEGDKFIGVSNPQLRAICKNYWRSTSLEDLHMLFIDPVHERRLLGVFILVEHYQKARKDLTLRKQLVDFYINHLDGVNNWDLVDSSAYKILGDWLLDKDRDILYTMAHSEKLWHERVAMVSTMAFIKKDDFKDTFKLAEYLLHHNEDIMQKAVGWMLKEVGKKNQSALEPFLKAHYQNMPRTTLRYAIEKFNEDLRQAYLKGDI